VSLMSTTEAKKTVAEFKSERAAKVAMTKAEKAYEDALRAANCAYRDAMNTDGVDPFEAQRAANEKRDAAADHGRAVYAQATAQGFYVRSWYFSDSNPTRDLIAANMD